jgi:hypothetical protein
MNHRTAKLLLPLVNDPQMWEAMQTLLSEQIHWTNRALAVETSELELRRLQGKAALLEMLNNLPESVNSSLKNYEIEKQNNAQSF